MFSWVYSITPLSRMVVFNPPPCVPHLLGYSQYKYHLVTLIASVKKIMRSFLFVLALWLTLLCQAWGSPSPAAAPAPTAVPSPPPPPPGYGRKNLRWGGRSAAQKFASYGGNIMIG